MLRVSQSSAAWRRGGVGSGDVASLLGIGYAGGPLVLWARKAEMVDRQYGRGVVRKLADLTQGSPEWHRFRALGVGGSEVASVLAANKYQPPESVWKKKAFPEADDGEAENENMRRGKELEPDARRVYEDLYGWAVQPLCVIHDTYEHVRCSLDGIRPDDKLIVEIKAPNPDRPYNHDEALRGRIQGYYRCQIQYQLLITGAEVCHFVSYCPGAYSDHRRFAVIDVRPDAAFQEVILERVNEFWDYVLRREPPPVEWCLAAVPVPPILPVVSPAERKTVTATAAEFATVA